MTAGFTAVPHTIDDSDLDVYQFRIWHRVKRRGICFESQRSIADSTGISLAQVNRTIKWLRSNGWIVPSVDKKSGKVGYESVIPEEQVQQNSVIPGEHVIPEVEHVIPEERHLKKNHKENNNITRDEKAAIGFFEGMTAFTSPHESTMQFSDHWVLPIQAILKISSNFDEAEKRITWAIQEMRKKGYTIKSPKSILTFALNWSDGQPSPNGNGRIDKAAMKSNLWHIVTRSRDYKEAKGNASPDEWNLLTAMGKWRDVRSLNETTFSIKFYEVYKQNGNH